MTHDYLFTQTFNKEGISCPAFHPELTQQPISCPAFHPEQSKGLPFAVLKSRWAPSPMSVPRAFLHQVSPPRLSRLL